jgi:hypothetical protein
VSAIDDVLARSGNMLLRSPPRERAARLRPLTEHLDQQAGGDEHSLEELN